MIDASVVVPVLDAACTLDACLTGLLGQDRSRESFEIIVVDNNSRDGSADLARRHPGVRVLHEPRQGAYAARNRGLREARGRFVAFTDPDCVPCDDWLSRLTAAMADPEVMVVMGRDRPAGRSRAVRLLGEYEHAKERWVTSREEPSVYYGHTNNMLVRRELFSTIGPFDERRRGGDVILVQSVIARHGTRAVRYEPAALVDHLEIRSARTYFKKAFLYGASAHRYSRIVPARPLDNAERLEIFRETVRGRRLGALDRGYLLALLGVGLLFFQAGWLWAGRRPRRASRPM